MNDHEFDEGEDGGDEGETDTEGGENVVPLRPQPRPVARYADTSESVAGSVPLLAYGAVPPSASYWACHKQGPGGVFAVQSWGEPGGTVELREWPLAELSEATILRRWGAGAYKLQWLRPTDNGGRKSLSYGRVFTLRDPVVAPVPAAVAPVANDPIASSFGLAMQIMGMIEKNADAKITGMAQMAQMFAGQRGGGLGAAELQLILQNQAAQNQAAITAAVAAAVAPLNERLAQFDPDDDDEEAAGAVGAAVRAAAPLIKGKGLAAGIINFAASNPEVVKQVAPLALAFGSGVLNLFQQQRAAQQQQAQQAQPPAYAPPRARVPERAAVEPSPPRVEWTPGPAPAPAAEVAAAVAAAPSSSAPTFDWTPSPSSPPPAPVASEGVST